MKKYNIKYQSILGHSDISPDRKKDPGEKFPWKELFKNRLSMCTVSLILRNYKIKKNKIIF